MQHWYVYMLLCSDDSIYTGIATDVHKRFLTHQTGKGGNYTRSHRVVKILYSESHSTKSAALKREIEIKGLLRKKKLTLIHEGLENSTTKIP